MDYQKTLKRMRYLKARYKASLMGWEAEDLTHEFMKRGLEGRSSHQTLQQFVIDIIRQNSVRACNKKYTPIEKCKVSIPPVEILEAHADKLKGTDRAIVTLMSKWGFSGDEIAHAFGWTKSRVSQRLSEIVIKLREIYKGEK